MVGVEKKLSLMAENLCLAIISVVNYGRIMRGQHRGCGSDGRVVASFTKYPQFEPNQRQIEKVIRSKVLALNLFASIFFLLADAEGKKLLIG